MFSVDRFLFSVLLFVRFCCWVIFVVFGLFFYCCGWFLVYIFCVAIVIVFVVVGFRFRRSWFLILSLMVTYFGTIVGFWIISR